MGIPLFQAAINNDGTEPGLKYEVKKLAARLPPTFLSFQSFSHFAVLQAIQGIFPNNLFAKKRLLTDFLDPSQAVIGHLVPAFFADDEVIASGKHFELSDG